MIQSYRDLKFYLYADAKMSRLKEPGMSFWYNLFHNNYRKKYLRTLRITEWLHNCRNKSGNLWMWVVYLYYSRKLDKLAAICGFDIPLNSLGYGVNIAHIGSIVINPAAKIGNYCALMNNIVIGDSNKKIIGNGVLIGSNVVIIKNITISEGGVIAAQSLVNKSIEEPNSVWGGIPAKEIKKNQKKWYENDTTVKSIYESCEELRLKLGII